MAADFSLTARDDAPHRAGFPDELSDRPEALGVVTPGGRGLDTDVRCSPGARRGRVRACVGVVAGLGPDAGAAIDTTRARMPAERFSAEPLAVPHRVWDLAARREL